MTVSAVRPWRTALRRERVFAFRRVGPVLLSALRRLASICFSELMTDQVKLGSFCRGQERHPRGYDIAPRPGANQPGPIAGDGRLVAHSACQSVFRYGLGGNFIGLRRIGGADFGWVCSQSLSGDLQRFDVEVFPPGHFIAGLMQLPVMTAAERNGELVADFKADGSGLGKPQMMRVAGLPAADETGL